MTRPTLLLVTSAWLLFAAAPTCAESIIPRQSSDHARVRTTDRRLHGLIADGIRTSRTFRSLVERLTDSDVVVYLQEDQRPRPGVDGRMTFIAAAGGTRYLAVRVVYLSDVTRQIAIIAHELRHAVEVADAPEVVDEQSLAREYVRIGQENADATVVGRTFDTDAAVSTGYRVLREIRRGNAD